MSYLRLAAAACLLPTLALAADRPPLKLGLWEITTESQGGPALPPGAMPQLSPEQLAKLPPEARARIEAMAAGRAGGGNHTFKQCLTAKSLDHAFQNDDERARKCTRTIVSQTSSGVEVRFECPNLGPGGAGNTHGTLKWTMLNPETTQGSLEMTLDIGRGPMTHTTGINGKWVSSDCGDVKPREESAK